MGRLPHTADIPHDDTPVTSGPGYRVPPFTSNPGGYITVVPRGLATDPRLSAEQVGIAVYVLSFTGQDYPGIRQIASALHVRPVTVRDALHDLIVTGWFEAVRP